MKNSDRFKTAKERAEAFVKFCDNECGACPLYAKPCHAENCQFYWLDLEAEAEEPLPCPFCGGKVQVLHNTQAIAKNAEWLVDCYGCQYEYGAETKEALIAAHNRVARAAAKEKEARND